MSKLISATDTVLDSRKVKRIIINTDNEFIVFYITFENENLPISYFKDLEKDENGTIIRIDTYQRADDRFITIKINKTDSLNTQIYNLLKGF